MRKFKIVVALLVVLGSLNLAAIGQTSLGSVSGTVRDSAGAVVPDATVLAKNEATGETRTTTTKGDGQFRIDAVNPGPYTIHVTKSGFKDFDLQHLGVKPSVITSYDVALSVAGTTSEVTVETANTAVLDVESGQIASTIGAQELQSIPVFSNNPVELVETLPGVQVVNNNGGISNGFNISVNGSRSRANNFLIDGQDDNDNAISGQALQANMPDMYSNVVALTNAYSAEYGRGGGAVINLITKSGTNKFHGTVYDLYTGSGLDAIDGLSRGSGNPKARYDQHQYGFTVGGPIIKDKLFGFGGAQYTRFYGKATPSTIHLPDAASYAKIQAIGTPNALLLLKYIGSLSQYLPTTGSTTTVNIINEPGCTACTLSFVPYKRPNQAQQNPETQWTYKVDWLATKNDTLAIRYLHDRQSLTPDFFNFASQLPGFDAEQGGPAEQGAGTYTHVFSPRIVNEFRASETRIAFSFASTPATVANPLYTAPPVTIANTALPLLGPQSTSLPQGRGHDIYQFQDTVSISFGRNTIRLGADVGRAIVRDFIPFNLYGTLSYTKSAAVAATSTPAYTALNNFFDNYLGTAGSATKSFGSPRVDSHQWQTAYFVQDDVKVTPDLTVNLGLRYEFQTNPENAVKYPALNPATALTDPINTLYKVKEDRNNLAPRIGFAYNPHNGGHFLADGKTVYHGAFGIFYDVVFTNITDNSQSTAPNNVSGQIIQTTGRGAANANTLIPSISPVLTPLNSVSLLTTNNLVNPETFQWNLGFERQMPGEIKWTVNYVASRSEKLFANQQYNYFNPATGKRLNPSRGAISARGNFADSEYESIQTEVSHDFRHGLFIRGAYTYGKNLDDGSEIFTLFSSPTSYSANLAPGGRRQDWGPSAYDFRHNLSISYAYTVPGLPRFQGKAADSLAEIVTRNWQFSGTTFFQSGPYKTFNVNGLDVNGDGSSSNDRPLVANPNAPLDTAAVDGAIIGGTPGVYYDYGQNDTNGTFVPVQLSQVHWYVPYPYTPQQMAAEIGRNSFSGPGYYMFNFALQKGFKLPLPHLESSSLVLRAEAENVFNHNNVDAASMDLDIFDIQVPNTVGNSFLDKPSARFDDNRHLRLWVKYVF